MSSVSNVVHPAHAAELKAHAHPATALLKAMSNPARLTVLAVETPDGPSYVAGALGRGVGGGEVATTVCGSEIRPASTAIEPSSEATRPPPR